MPDGAGRGAQPVAGHPPVTRATVLRLLLLLTAALLPHIVQCGATRLAQGTVAVARPPPHQKLSTLRVRRVGPKGPVVAIPSDPLSPVRWTTPPSPQEPAPTAATEWELRTYIPSAGGYVIIPSRVHWSLLRLAKLGPTPGPRPDPVALELGQALSRPEVLAHLTGRETAQALWALRKCRVRSASLAMEFGRHLLRLSDVGPRTVATAVVAMAHIGVREADLYRQLAHHGRLPTAPGDYLARELVNVLWAFARAGVQDDTITSILLVSIGQQLSLLCPQEVANAVWAAGKLAPNAADWFRAMAEHALRSDVLGQCDAPLLAQLAWGFATAKVNVDGLFEAISAAAQGPAVLQGFRLREVTAMTWAFAATGRADVPFFRALAGHLLRANLLRIAAPSYVSSLAWAYACLGLRHVPLLRAVEARLAAPGALIVYDSAETSLLAWAAAKLGWKQSALVWQLAQHLLDGDNLLSCSPPNLARYAWAFAKLGHADPRLWAALAEQLLDPDTLAGLEAQDVANVAWAFAVLRRPCPPLFAALTARASALPLVGQAVANLLWACATLGFQDGGFLAAVGRRLRSAEVLATLSPLGLANVVWAYAMLNVRQPEVTAALASRLAHPSVLAAMPGPELTMLCWACARLGIHHAPLLGGLHDRLLWQGTASPLSLNELATIAWAFTTLGLCSPDLLRGIAAQSIELLAMGEFDLRAIRNLAWAFAKLNFLEPALMAALAAALLGPPARLSLLTPQEAAVVLWAFAWTAPEQTALFASVADHLLRSSLLSDCSVQQLVVIARAFATARFVHEELMASIATQIHLRLGEVTALDAGTLAVAVAKQELLAGSQHDPVYGPVFKQ
eukprot:EG_transcript_3125